MGTMDGLTLAGGKPANFLDGCGGADLQSSTLTAETFKRDPRVTSIFVNTFGGATKTCVVVDGLIDAIHEKKMKRRVVV